jgi:hypothetical protein
MPRFAVEVVFPTPPLPEVMTIMRLINKVDYEIAGEQIGDFSLTSDEAD